MLPLLSICSLTYNHKRFLKRALDGFMMQKTQFAFEVLVNDDASSDGTTEILETYQQKYPDIIKPVFHKENLYSKGVRGLYNRNLFPLAKGKYIAICDGDDYWTDKLKLQKQVDFLEQNPGYSLCGHDVFFRKGNLRKRSYHWNAPANSNLSDLLQKGNYLASGSMVFKRIPEVFDFIKQFPDPPYVDFLLCIGLARHGKIRIMKERMGVYRVHKKGLWSGLKPFEAYYKTLPVIERLFNLLEPVHQNDVRIYFMNLLEQVLAADPGSVGHCERTKELLNKMGFPENFGMGFLKNLSTQKNSPACLARMIPRSILKKSLVEKRRNLRVRGMF